MKVNNKHLYLTYFPSSSYFLIFSQLHRHYRMSVVHCSSQVSSSHSSSNFSGSSFVLEAVDPIKTSLLPLRSLICWLEELTPNLFHPNDWADIGPSEYLKDLSHDFRPLFLENISQFKLERVLCIVFVLGASDGIVSHKILKLNK